MELFPGVSSAIASVRASVRGSASEEWSFFSSRVRWRVNFLLDILPRETPDCFTGNTDINSFDILGILPF